MEIISEEQQIRERFLLVEQLISWQQMKTKRARRRYHIKDYNKTLEQKLINCR